MVSATTPLSPFLEARRVLIIDGGLATELEARGFELADELWSARLLIDEPAAIRQVHYDYLVAGADCIISASYQATVSGLMRWAISHDEAEGLLRLSVDLAVEARNAFWNDRANRKGRIRPLVAASVGPYGAALADGSEYTGNYELDEEGLYTFHRQRWHLLAKTQADILACETIPSHAEAKALDRLLRETPDRFAWFSFSCRNERQISDGTLLATSVAHLDLNEQVAAVGINCTAPRYIPGLVAEARSATDKPIVVYPNSGERYDADRKRWRGEASAGEFVDASESWYAAGATLIGGCCRTSPDHIARIRKKLLFD